MGNTDDKGARHSWNHDDTHIGIEEQMETELQQFRQQGAIPRHLVMQQQTDFPARTRPAASTRLPSSNPKRERGEGIGGEGEQQPCEGAVEVELGEAEQQRRAAE